jgi:N-acetylneuraminic acid mutarotase
MRFHSLLLCLFLTCYFNICDGQSTWEQLANHPSPGIERTFSFEIDGIVYVGSGRSTLGETSSVIQSYNPATDTWTRKADFPGPSRRNAFAFQVGGIGYMGTGYDGSAHLGDFWKYDPANDSWTQLGDFPGGIRSHALAIAGDSTAYVLTGGREVDSVFKKDMWKFTPATESWTMLDDFPGGSRWRAFGWIIGQKLYVGGGARFPSQASRDFYVYDLVSNTWNENARAVCPTRKSNAGFFFTINGKGYYGEGSNGLDDNAEGFGKRLFVYDPMSDNWEEEVEFIGPERILGFSEVVDGKAIIGLGRNYVAETDYKDIYSFTPGTTASISLAEDLDLKVFPNPVSSSKLSIQGEFIAHRDFNIFLYDMKGARQHLSTEKISDIGPDLMQINVGHLIPGVYQLEMTRSNQRVTLRFIKQ